ncbi:MAG: M23 family metallopeptidase, partial [Trebonia sp.]
AEAQAKLKAARAISAAKAEAARIAALPKWVRPSAGRLSSPFGKRWGRMHNGIDLAAGYGAPIVAAAAGTVVYAGPESGYGRIIKIAEPDGTQTWYGHMEKCLVKAGDRVKAGQKIALVGAAGDATGPHLHFEVHVAGSPVDPIPFLAAHGVRI